MIRPSSFFPQLRYAAAPDRWIGNDSFRLPDRAATEAYLASIRAGRDDVLETRVVDSSFKPTHIWNFEHGVLIPRGMGSRSPHQDKRR